MFNIVWSKASKDVGRMPVSRGGIFLNTPPPPPAPARAGFASAADCLSSSSGSLITRVSDHRVIIKMRRQRGRRHASCWSSEVGCAFSSRYLIWAEDQDMAGSETACDAQAKELEACTPAEFAAEANRALGNRASAPASPLTTALREWLPGGGVFQARFEISKPWLPGRNRLAALLLVRG